jgi:hypothetical protein
MVDLRGFEPSPVKQTFSESKMSIQGHSDFLPINAEDSLSKFDSPDVRKSYLKNDFLNPPNSYLNNNF